MVKHVAAVTVEAPAADLFRRLSRFETYPQIFSFVHDVAPVEGEIIPDRRIVWRSLDESAMTGRITFEPEDDDSTVVTVTVSYEPRAGALEALGGGAHFEAQLTHDLELFARMVEGLPAEIKEPRVEPADEALAENAPLVPGTTPREVD